MATNLEIKPPRELQAVEITDLTTPSWWTRLQQGFKYVLSGKNDDWFGPRQPITPVAPDDVAGRQMDYMVGANLNYIPKYGEGISFAKLQTLSQTWPLLRLVIEMRKDQICQLDWNIVPKDKSLKSTPAGDKIEEFLRYPDKVHCWSDWLRMIMEDMLVTDTATVYPRPAKDGTLYALDPIDGTTIKRLIDDHGRTPCPPVPAYQQILHGLPANNYTYDQLIYRPRNVRAGKIYGFSTVEQIILTITIALNRESSTLAYYTDGSTADLILSVPESWNPTQIAQFKAWWDSILAGNNRARRGTMFVFNGTAPINTKDKVLTDKMDEWIARVLCFAFGMSSQPFIQQNTRAAAVTAATAAKEEGLEPVMQWVTNLMNYIIEKYFAQSDLMFQFKRNMETDPLTRAQVFNLKVKAGASSLNEWRQADGDEPIPDGDKHLIYAGQTVIPLDMAIAGEGIATNGGSPASGDGQKTAANKEGRDSNNLATQTKGNKNTKTPATQTNDKLGPRSPKSMRVAKMRKMRGRPIGKDEIELSREIAAHLRTAEQAVFKALVGLDQEQDVEIVLIKVDLSLKAIEEPVRKAIQNRLEVGYKSAMQALNKAVDVAGGDASAYAATRAAELVTQVDETTRVLIRNLVVRAFDEGWTKEELAKALADNFAFSPVRASVIASTELNDALTQAELSAWRDSGVVKSIEWITSPLEGVCAVCEANESAGPVDLGGNFPSGDDGPPAHPNCRCAISPIMSEE